MALRPAANALSPFFSSTRPKNAMRRSGSGMRTRNRRCGLAGGAGPGEVRDHESSLRELPALVAHPLDEVGARTDDDVRELHRGLFERADGEHGLQIGEGDVRREVCDVASRSMAEDHEQRVLERDAGLPETQRRVRRSAEVVSDHDVGRVRCQSERDAVWLGEVPGLDELFAWRGRPDLDSGVGVDAVPVRVD